MSVTYAQMKSRGAGYIVFNSQTILSATDINVDNALVTDVVESSLLGEVDEVEKDFLTKVSFTPQYYDTAAITTMFPWLGQLPGFLQPGNSAQTCEVFANNLDTYLVASGVVGKMPDFSLGVNGLVMGPMEIWGVLPYGVDPTSSTAYYTQATAGSYANPAVPSTAVLGRQEFQATWGGSGSYGSFTGGVTGFSSFQAYDKWKVTHDLKLEPVVVQGRTRCFALKSYRTMLSCIPVGPTAAQISAAQKSQGSGAGGGSQLSANASTMIIAGSGSMTLTAANCAIKTAGYRFGSTVLRNGEVGWVTTNPYAVTNGGSSTTPLQLA